MGMKLHSLTPLLAAGAAAVAIAAAPTAFAANQQTCSGTVCQSPGNVKIKTPPPHVQYHPYGPHMSSSILTGHALHLGWCPLFAGAVEWYLARVDFYCAESRCRRH